MIHFVHFFDTALGRMGVVWSAAGIRRFRLPDLDESAALRDITRGLPDVKMISPTGPTDALVMRVRDYADGAVVDFADVVLDWHDMGAGDRAIYAGLRKVERGTTVTYGMLAEATAAPGGARGVGQAMGRNPWPLIVPCHRVVGADGRLVGFSAPGGTATKARMLTLEAASPPSDPRQASFAF